MGGAVLKANLGIKVIILDKRKELAKELADIKNEAMIEFILAFVRELRKEWE